MNAAEAYSTVFTDYPDVFTVPQFCKMIGVSGKTGYRLIKENKIKYIQVGRSYRIPGLCCRGIILLKSCAS